MISSYGTPDFLARFIPSGEVRSHLKKDFGAFLIMRVEDMYRHADKPVPPSRSTTHILIAITDGEAHMSIAGQNATARKNELFLIPAGQIFSFEEYNPEKYNKGFICIFDKQFAPSKEFPFLNTHSTPSITPGTEIAKNIIHCCERMLAEYHAHGIQHQGLIRSYLSALLYEIASAWHPLQSRPHSAALVLTDRFRAALSSHIARLHLVTDYARLLNVSAAHLNRTIRTSTGKAPSKWIDETIILEAKILLTQTDKPIGDIASAIGIEDPSYFSRLFKRHTGQSPLQFRSAATQ